jgi:hypothetical protein
MVLKYGDDRMHKMYLAVCQELLEEKARAAGYALSRWTGYYCGALHDMTRFVAADAHSDSVPAAGRAVAVVRGRAAVLDLKPPAA